ncbi:DoxX family protein [Flavobacterium sp. xlx-214]|uniref:DoxX family protein n=1 Tax=unclassified Flavobacterium TaxID=196869 RepID=UPI0013D49C0B|nr:MULTISPECIES: DoxX family protein [unclassified Flavobacterium]MBA5792208.1 DoxX family protein [Flavobacterium sp. xlx-221]QMI84451.1 DoxX family protein [Flavobacterium sp. xlx-214]
MTYITEIMILLFLALTFLQSGYDKAIDWKGNVGWLKSHFANTFLGNKVPFALGIILILELFAALFSLIGIYQLICNNNKDMALYAGITSSITLLLLLYGQRIAKDYDGARTIVIYFIPTVFLLFLLK